MVWGNLKVEDQKRHLVQQYIDNVAPMTEICRRFGVTTKTGYKWYNRFVAEGEEGLKDQSKAPKDPARLYSDEQIEMALTLKCKHPARGPKKIQAMLKRQYPNLDWPSATRLYEIFKEHHLVSSRRLRRRVPRTHPLGEVNHSNDVWMADFKGWFLTQDGSKVEPLTITDGHSRYLIKCEHMPKKCSQNVWKIYEQAFYEYGLPKRIRTDNGPPFGSVGVGRLTPLSVNLIKAGVQPEWIRPGHPEENGRHERFHLTLKNETANPPARTLNEQLTRTRAFVDEYNYDRPHESLNQSVPASRYEPSAQPWNGILRSPEYDTGVEVRKVCASGCIWWRQKEYYFGKVLSGDYVSLQESDNDILDVHYGPVYLGKIHVGVGFERPEMPKRKKRRNL